MPTYVYACDSCGVQFEKFQSFKEDPIQSCPQCNKESVRRVFQPVGIVFKGSGWYITDSRNSNNATLGNNNNNNTKSKEPESNNSTNGQESKGSDKGSESSNTASDSSKGSESKVSESKASSTSS